MLEKMSVLDITAQQVKLNIHRRKNTVNTNPIPFRGEPTEDVDSFTYLWSIVSKTGGTDKDVKARIQKPRNAFLMMFKEYNFMEIEKLQTSN